MAAAPVLLFVPPLAPAAAALTCAIACSSRGRPSQQTTRSHSRRAASLCAHGAPPVPLHRGSASKSPSSTSSSSFPPPSHLSPHKPDGRSRVPRAVDYATLAHCVAALSELAVPARVESVRQTSATALVLAVRTLDASYRVVLSFAQAHGRLSVVPPQALRAGRRSNSDRDGGGGGGGAKAATDARREKEVSRRYSLAATARALLASAPVLVAARIAAPFDRIAALEFGAAPGSPPTVHLFLELLGNGRSNLVVTDASLSIKACGRQVASRTAARALQTGLTYTRPPPPRGLHPADPTLPGTLLRLAGNAVEKQQVMGGSAIGSALVCAVAGISPAVAELVCSRASLDPRQPLCELESSADNSWADALATSVREWHDAHACAERVTLRPAESDRSPGGDQNGAHEYQYNLLPPSALSDKAVLNERLIDSCISLERYYAKHETAVEVDMRAAKVTKVLEKKIARARSRTAVFERKVAECSTIDQLRRDAELLYSFAHNWSPGETVVRGDWVGPTDRHRDSGDGVEVSLPGDGGLTPIEYGQQLYRKAAKLARSRDIAQSRLDEGLREMEWLEGMTVNVAMARSIKAIAELEAEVALEAIASPSRDRISEPKRSRATNTRIKSVRIKKKGKTLAPEIPKHSQASAQGRHGQSSVGYLSGVLVIAWDGLQVLVGRSARGNETVTFELAKKGDAWLHAAGTAGAHVIVRRGDGGNLGSDAEVEKLQFAADLAAFFSKASQSANVPVSVVRAGDVRRAPGSPRRHGSVILPESTRTINAKPLRVQDVALAALADRG